MFADRLLKNEGLVTALTKQLNLELRASYLYLAAACYCGQHQVALPGFRQFFMTESNDEAGHAEQLINYLLERGVVVDLLDVPKPIVSGEGKLRDYLISSLQMEEQVTDSIYQLMDLVDEIRDHHLSDWLANFGAHQTKAIHDLKSLLTTLDRVGTKEGLYELDNHLAHPSKKEFVITSK